MGPCSCRLPSKSLLSLPLLSDLGLNLSSLIPEKILFHTAPGSSGLCTSTKVTCRPLFPDAFPGLTPLGGWGRDGEREEGRNGAK